MRIYNRNFVPLNVPNLPITIFGSGSSGNSVKIDPIRFLIDLGLPYSRYPKQTFNQLDYLALTHEHMDHINPATLERVLSIYPNVKVLITERLYNVILKKRPSLEDYHVQFFEPNQPFECMSRDNIQFTVHPHTISHGDILNIAYDIRIPSMHTRLLYASDLDTEDGDPSRNISGLPQTADTRFNLMLLEANYSYEKVLETIQSNQQKIDAKAYKNEEEFKTMLNQIHRATENFRHFSEESAARYAQRYLTPNGIFIPLHASSTFGTYIQ